MSLFGPHLGQGPGNSSTNTSANSSSSPSGTAGVYGRGDLQAAFNWLVNQPEHIRKQASDPDRLMTLYYRSNGRAEMIRETPQKSIEPRTIESEAPVSGQTFISDLRQINEALRQFDGPTAQAAIHNPLPPPQPVQSAQLTQNNLPPLPSPSHSPSMAFKTQHLLAEVREKLNLSSETEALNVLISLGYKALKPLLG